MHLIRVHPIYIQYTRTVKRVMTNVFSSIISYVN